MIHKFTNGYGASVINHDASYGLELAVIKFNALDSWEICYDTHITDGVMGYLTQDKLKELLKEIEDL